VVMYVCSCVVEGIIAARTDTEGAQGAGEARDTQDFEMRNTNSTVDTVNMLHHRSSNVV